MFRDSIISGNGKYIDIYSFEGELKDKIDIDNQMGEIIHFNANKKYLLVVCSNNFFGIFDISRRKLKQILTFRKFERNGLELGEIRDASVNCKGNFIGFLCDTMANSEVRIPETKFYIYDIEMDSFSDYEIGTNRIPIEIVWDQDESRLFGIQTEYAKDLNDASENLIIETSKKEWAGPEFFIFFYTSEYGIHVQESHKINRDIQGIFALAVPSIYFIISKAVDKQKHSLSEKKFQFFEGLEKIDETTKANLIEFSIYMSSGKIDEAYKIVKNIKNQFIWENMAQICVKTKRLDVLEVCLSNMRFARGIKAVRILSI